MKICIVLSEKFPQSIRIEKEVRTFQSLGYEVYLYCFRTEGQKLEEGIGAARIYRHDQSRGLAGRLHRLIYKLTFVNLESFLAIRRIILRHRIQVLFVRELSLVRTAVILGRVYGPKVIYDVANRYPLAIKAWGMKQSLNERLLMSNWRMRGLEKWCLKHVHRVVVAVPPYVDQFMSMGIPANKITLLPNYEDLQWIYNLRVDRQICSRYKSEFVILYVGTFGLNRELEVPIKAMPFVLQHVSNARLVMAGPLESREEWRRIKLQRLAEELGVSDRVDLPGFIEFEKLPSYISMSNVCLYPLAESEHSRGALGHKLFNYMAFGKPVIVTDVKSPQNELVESEGCGIVVPCGSPGELSKAVVKLYDNPALAAAMGRRGKQAVESRYNWEKGSQEFVKMLRELENTTS